MWKGFQSFGAMLRDVATYRERLSVAPEGEDVQQVNVIEAPEVREILMRLRQAREHHLATVADKGKADAEANRVASEIEQARAELERKEKAMAISGGLPEDAFPEEAQITRLERQQRVALASVSVTQERVTASQMRMDDLSKQLDAAWLQVGVERCRELVASFRQAAMALRKVQCDHMAWLRCFSNKPGIVSLGGAYVVDGTCSSGVTEVNGCLVFNGRLVDGHMLWESEEYWRPLSGDLADAIRALHNEVEEARQGKM
jgi:hypothetical protein